MQLVEPRKEPQPPPTARPPKTVKLAAHDMQVIFQEVLTPQQQQQIAADPEQKKKFVAHIKKVLAVAHVAEQGNYAEHADLKPQLSFQLDLALNDPYKKKHPDAIQAKIDRTP